MTDDAFPPHDRLKHLAEARLLAEGSIALVARILSSNATFVVDVTCSDAVLCAVYKPEAGERRLWDFEPGLHRRELAAYRLSEWLGWGIVPPTVVRSDAPAGVGSVQLFVEGDQTEHYFTLLETAPETHAMLRAIAVFDLVANNTDRKGGHVLRGLDGRVWGIDHGLCFAASEKLRTVIWDFAGERVPTALLDAVEPLARDVPDDIAELLSDAEVTAISRRARRLLDSPVFPTDLSGRRIPWPLI